jgi:hypothetical protein
MKIRKVNKVNIRPKGSGAFGQYYRIKSSKIGIKILFGCETFRSIKALKKSKAWKECEKEYKKLVRISKRTELTPRPKGMAIVRMNTKNKFYRCGYCMEHIVGTTVEDSTMSDRDYELLESAEIQLESDRVYWSDSHHGNVMKTKIKDRRFIFIDAGGLHLTRR